MTKEEFKTATIRDVYLDLRQNDKYSYKELADLYDEIIHELLDERWESFTMEEKNSLYHQKDKYIQDRYKYLFMEEVIDEN